MKKSFSNNKSLFYVLLGAIGVMLCVGVGVAAWAFMNPTMFASALGNAPAAAPVKQDQLWAQVEISKPLVKPVEANALAAHVLSDAPVIDSDATSTETPEPTIEPTDAPTSEPIEEPTLVPEIVETPAQLAMEIVPPTPTSQYVPPTAGPKPVYASSGNGSRWIDVDLTNQRVYAYEGDVIVNSFLVSTGTWATPTVTGQYNIYVKYRSAKMSGPGYYLPNVPYIMYFYGGYGLHGTYWHNNFGTPMSHGCVNLRTEDAEWLFNWASIGTLVNVHY